MKVPKVGRIRYLGQHDPGERQRFMDALNQSPDHFQTIVMMALNTGLRRGEILSLEWGDINMEARRLSLRTETTKSAEPRHIPLNDEIYEALRQWRTEQGAFPISGVVFPSPVTGKRLRRICFRILNRFFQ